MGKRTVVTTLLCCQLARGCCKELFVVFENFGSCCRAYNRQSLVAAVLELVQLRGWGTYVKPSAMKPNIFTPASGLT